MSFINDLVPSCNSSCTSHLLKPAFLALSSVTIEDLRKLSSVENRFFNHCAECARCKKGKRPVKSGFVDWILDSGASKHFTHELSDLAEYKLYDGPSLTTAAKKAPLQVKGEGTMFLTHDVPGLNGQSRRVITRLSPVYYVPHMSGRLLSVGDMLVNGYTMYGDAESMQFYKRNSRVTALEAKPHMPGQTIFWLHAEITPASALLAKSTINLSDYDLWHKRFGHPSKQVLQQAQRQVNNFPQSLKFPERILSVADAQKGKCTRNSCYTPFSENSLRPKEFSGGILPPFQILNQLS